MLMNVMDEQGHAGAFPIAWKKGRKKCGARGWNKRRGMAAVRANKAMNQQSH
jgi:hypothetical protein